VWRISVFGVQELGRKGRVEPEINAKFTLVNGFWPFARCSPRLRWSVAETDTIYWGEQNRIWAMALIQPMFVPGLIAVLIISRKAAYCCARTGF
jgi:hypothetical protein